MKYQLLLEHERFLYMLMNPPCIRPNRPIYPIHGLYPPVIQLPLWNVESFRPLFHYSIYSTSIASNLISN